MSIINTLNIPNFCIETILYENGTIGQRTHYLLENKYKESIMYGSNVIRVDTWSDEDEKCQKLFNYKKGEPKIIEKRVRKSRVKKQLTSQQILRTKLLNLIVKIKKNNNTAYPKREEYINKSNDELSIYTEEFRQSHIEPREQIMNSICAFKKLNKLRLPTKKSYTDLDINDLQKLLDSLVNNEFVVPVRKVLVRPKKQTESLINYTMYNDIEDTQIFGEVNDL
jgi:hypothetical protein